jgi:hypothetical protein
MTDDDDALDTLLRRHGPATIDDDGFTARTLQAIPDRPRARPDLARSRALALEQQRYALQRRLWRWATAGVVAGTLLAAAVVIGSPGEIVIDLGPAPATPEWLPLSLVLAAGSIWYAWKEFRSN